MSREEAPGFSRGEGVTASFTFAHMADVHLGAYSKELRQLNLQAFLTSLDRCLSRKVDFILIAGDLFHINVPDLAVVERAADKLREVKEAGVPVYVWYGSHDYSPTEKSIIDVLASAGLFTKVAGAEPRGGGSPLKLRFTTDGSTGAKITAIAGKAQGLDRHLFASLDRAALESESGFKVFGFHAAVREFLPPYLAHIEAVSVADFPRGFDYYAGGHIHHYHEERREGYGPFVNPGPTFGSDGRDVQNDEPRGFVLASVKGDRVEARFERVEVSPFLRLDLDVAGQSAEAARRALEEKLSEAPVDGRAIVLRVHGELASGKRSELDLDALYARLPKQGARAVHIVKAFSVREAGRQGAAEAGTPQAEVEQKVLAGHLERFGSLDRRFQGKRGVDLMLALKDVLAEEAPPQRGGKTEFGERLRERALWLLDHNGAEAPTPKPPSARPPETLGSGPARRERLEEFL